MNPNHAASFLRDKRLGTRIKIEPAPKEVECYGCLEPIRPGELCEVRYSWRRVIGYLCSECRQDRWKMNNIKGFRVIDKQTGQKPDLVQIALNEDWAKQLVYCDIDGFYLSEDEKTLILADTCGNFVYCPPGRFEVLPKREVDSK